MCQDEEGTEAGPDDGLDFLQMHQTLRLTHMLQIWFTWEGEVIELISWASLIVALVFDGIDPVNQIHLHEMRGIKKIRAE